MSPQLRNIALGYARRYLARADDADDAASDALLMLWAVHDSLRDTAHAARLAAVIARNVAIDMLRRRRPTSISGDEAHTSWLLQQEVGQQYSRESARMERGRAMAASAHRAVAAARDAGDAAASDRAPHQ